MQPILTARQREVVNAIREIRAASGRSPTLRELGARIGLSSTGAVRGHLASLQAKGMLQPRRHGKQRGIELVQ